ncbi:MAG: hypothetical protein ACI80M_000743, partial [Gammaproteobacteria bacterium]
MVRVALFFTVDIATNKAHPSFHIQLHFFIRRFTGASTARFLVEEIAAMAAKNQVCAAVLTFPDNTAFRQDLLAVFRQSD